MIRECFSSQALEGGQTKLTLDIRLLPQDLVVSLSEALWVCFSSLLKAVKIHQINLQYLASLINTQKQRFQTNPIFTYRKADNEGLN